MTPPRQIAVELEPPEQATPIAFHEVVRLQSSPDPREILHVPRSYPV